jgi:hypothetical protein
MVFYTAELEEFLAPLEETPMFPQKLYYQLGLDVNT